MLTNLLTRLIDDDEDNDDLDEIKNQIQSFAYKDYFNIDENI